MSSPAIKIPKLVRVLRDGPPGYYDRDDLQVAIWAAGLDMIAPATHAGLRQFYDTYFKRIFPPLVMVAHATTDRMGSLLVDLISQKNKDYYVKILLKEVFPRVGASEWLREARAKSIINESLIFLQREDAIQVFYEEMEFTNSQINQIEQGWNLNFKLSRDLFERWFEIANEINMGV